MLLLLFIFWVILNGKITLEIIMFGVGLTALLAILMKVLFQYSLQKEFYLYKKTPIFIAYIYILIREIIMANVNVIGVIIHPDKKVEPTLVKIHSGLKTNFGNFILANSITLTPGTITVSVEGDLLTIHCLSRSFLDISTFVEWIKKMEE